MKKTLFIKNALILTASGLVLRIIGVIFKVWLANIIGSEGIGLYQVVFSVFVFASTFATSGISTAVTRLCADNLANKNGISEIMRKALIISLFVALLSSSLLFFGADFIANIIINDARASLAIKTFSFAFPFMGICSCIRGYFIARRKAYPPAISQIIEQIIRITIVFFAVKTTINKGLAVCCAAIFLGDTISEMASCVILYIVYKLDKIKNLSQYKEITKKTNVVKKIRKIALPITSGRYLNSLLRTTENIIVPKFLRLYNKTKKNALSQFGMIKGMALPLIFFPSTLLNSISTLLIPELSEAKSKNQNYIVSSIVKDCISSTAIVSYYFSAFFFICGREIGFLIYKDVAVGNLIKILSPLIPLMYLDSICDGMLKGLNQQKFTFFTSVTDSALRIIFSFLIIPRFGLKGFIGIMYFSNIFTGTLNIIRLISVSKTSLNAYNTVFFPLFSAIFSVLLADLVASRLFYSITQVYIILIFLLSLPFFALLITKFTDFDLKKLL